MARPKKQEEVLTETSEKSLNDEKSIQELQAEALSNKAVMDANDSEKSKKDVLLMNTSALEAHIKYLTARMVELDQEYISRRKLVDGINGSIAGAQTELSNIRANVQKQHAQAIELLANKTTEVDKADKTLRALIKENNDLLVSNKQKESALIEERQICGSKVYEMQKALTQNQSEWEKREKDILAREASLKEERESHEIEKLALQPEAQRISSIKNENILLLQEVERGRNDINNLMLGIESEKQLLAEAKLIQDAKNKEYELVNANQEKKLREWEQNLKDFDLEVRARSAKADKLLRTMQLEKEAAGK